MMARESYHHAFDTVHPRDRLEYLNVDALHTTFEGTFFLSVVVLVVIFKLGIYLDLLT